ncbi:MAG TPA: hypothetical protein VIV11_00010 [Kofleriaceae bacterium]
MLDRWDRRALATSLDANGFIRGSSWRHGGRRGHREWLHFTIHAGDLRVVLNASFVDDVRPAAEPHRERVRLLALVHDGTDWHGAIDEITDATAPAGQLTARLGELEIAGTGGTFTLRGRCAALELDLTLVPDAFPSVASGVSLGDSPPINWLVVPRLLATGTIVLAGQHHAIADAPAYHDHNWGYFSHHDFAWQWGHDASTGPHSVVLARLLDRAYTTTFMQALLVWRDGRQSRVFRGDELSIQPEGFLRPAQPFTLPREAALLVDNLATEVPRALHLRAAGGGDELHGTFTAHTLARIVVPNDDSLTTTLIHEVIGELSLHGSLHGRPFALEAPAMFELLGSVR